MVGHLKCSSAKNLSCSDAKSQPQKTSFTNFFFPFLLLASFSRISMASV